MVSDITIFIAVAAGVVLLTGILMLVARRFHGLQHNQQPPEQRTRQFRLVFQLQPSSQPAKPFNVFTESELLLLDTVMLSKQDIEMLNSNAKPASGSSSLLHYASPECSICLVPYEDGETVRILSCDHVYHTNCIDVWLTKRSSKCPICKLDIRKKLGLGPQSELTNNSAMQESPEDAQELRIGQTNSPSNAHHVVHIAMPPPAHIAQM
ncbi:hypothetical protein H4R22_003225 [Coemansia sp. RSA 1290]|nr:hypothetical protein H4R22_003225 [Coemansia sp. RSA 1290]KAJ2648218.1 hypothetical protein IWW40_004089 [Coemansia sp. RSA 1250]